MHLDDLGQTWKTYKRGFESIWESVYGRESWDANPWVWVVEFRRLDNAALAEGPAESSEPEQSPSNTLVAPQGVTQETRPHDA